MNAIARAETVTGSNLLRSVSFHFIWPEPKVLLLLFLLLLSALGVVYVKDFNRRLFVAYQQLQIQLRELHATHNKLLLEYSAYGAEAYVQLVAQQKLEMQVPTAANVVMIKI